VEASDGLIVARGELGDEMGNEGVPYAQKVMIKRAKQVAEEGDFEYPVFVSTQIMESMIKNAVPTRAEVNDAINAVWDGADVLMCSGETAKGMFPMEGAMSMISCARVADAQKIHL
jgi:pyruvate kinase